MNRRLRCSGILVLAGLAVEAATLFWQHPTAFIVFLTLGASLTAAGILYYLYFLLRFTSSVDDLRK